jgi:hypothetical protein
MAGDPDAARQLHEDWRPVLEAAQPPPEPLPEPESPVVKNHNLNL